MEDWKLVEEERLTMEFRSKQIKRPEGMMAEIWTTKQVFVCSHNNTGGKKAYNKKHDRFRNIPSKKLGKGCPCRLTIKTYPNTDEILGLYGEEHSHEIGMTNSRFTRLRRETRIEIERLLREGVEPAKVVCIFFYQNIQYKFNPQLLARTYSGFYLYRRKFKQPS